MIRNKFLKKISKIIVIFISITVTSSLTPTHTKIGHYEGITSENCGIGRIKYFQIPYSSCFKHSLTIKQIRQMKAEGRIANGDEALSGQFPWMASIMLPIFDNKGQVKSYSSFGGAIIAQNWILTVAHAIYQNTTDQQMNLEPEDLQISVGILNCLYDYADSYDLNTTYWDAENIFIHPKYNDSSLAYDMALIKTTLPMEPQKTDSYFTLTSVCLPETNITNDKEELAIMSGCGSINSQNDPAKYLRKGDFKIIPFIKSSKEDENYLMLAGMQGIGKNSTIGCKGDSGSPLIQYVNGRGVLIGIFSSTLRRGNDQTSICSPGVFKFQRVSKYIDWIVSTIKEKTDSNTP